MKKIFLLLCFVIILFTGCRPYKEPIRIAINNWPPCELWYIAEKQGYFGDTPVEIIKFSTWSDSINSLYAGKTDLAHSTYLNTIEKAYKGEDAKIILSSSRIDGADGLVVKNYIEDLKELKGKKIAVEIGTDEHFLLYKSFEKIGISDKDVTIVPTTSEKAMKMFIAGKVDACFTYEPYMTQAAADGGGRVAMTTGSSLAGYRDAIIAKNKTLEERPKDYEVLISAWYKAQEYVKNNPKKAYKLMASKETLSLEEFKNFYESFYFFTPNDNKTMFSSGILESQLNELNEFLLKNNLLKSPVNVNDIYIGKIINEVSN
ncbi:ABC transporter substrate-binding protein [uncultured Ilyobacter sp.]|uniref:ABC transporter substrate-binding protein n=1 Tax=uncultured Ilyobacter sp. TaxID=544433 RepID=UPI0029C7AA3E|nr:ABC transporter substrate-binding protein [uncultured Ilyobacter sp.]